MSLEATEKKIDETPGLKDSVPVEKTATNDDAGESVGGAEQFDAAEWEAQLGFDAGAFSDCKSVEEVLQAVADSVDKTLVAGLTSGGVAEADPSSFPKADPEKPVEKAADTKTDNTAYEELKARLNLVETKLKESQASSQQAILHDLDRRLNKEIDTWASPKYGVGRNRNAKQIRAYRSFKEEMRTWVAGRAALGQAIPDVEAIARQVRIADDDTFDRKAAKPKAAPLGTPGTSKEQRPGTKEPRNIHEAVLNDGSF